MWKDAPEELKARVGEALERPVFFSVADDSEGIVFGADGAVVVSGERTRKVAYLDLAGVRCSEVGIETPPGKEFGLDLNVRSQGTIRAKVEGGAAGYGVWRVLQMVMNMREAWFAPKPEPEPEPEVGADSEAASGEAGSSEAAPEEEIEASDGEPDPAAQLGENRSEDGDPEASSEAQAEQERDAVGDAAAEEGAEKSGEQSAGAGG